MLKIKIILGSTREGRFGDKAANWILDEVKQRQTAGAQTGEQFDVELLDLRDYSMPFFDQAKTPSSITEPYPNPVVQKWTAKIAEADGFIVATAEYDHGIPAVLKNSFDWVFKEWARKPIAFVGWGSVGGARAVEHLRGVVAELQMASMRTAVHMVAPWTLAKNKTTGELEADAFDQYKASAKLMFDQLFWWGNALKTARAAEIKN